MKTEYPPRHINGFRPLVPGERWHRTDFTPDMLPEGWRPSLLGEEEQTGDEQVSRFGKWLRVPYPHGDVLPDDAHLRTRRPLPPPPPTFEHGGKVWNSHVPGDPCPVDDSKGIEGLMANGIIDTRLGNGSTASRLAKWWWWFDCGKTSLIGYRIPDAEPVNDTAKLRERIAELEQQLATALTPRPIAEAGPVKEGFVRLYGKVDNPVRSWSAFNIRDTHFIDLRLPSPDPRAEYERALAECGGDPVALYAKMKGGAA